MEIDYALLNHWCRGGWTTAASDQSSPFNPPYFSGHFDLWREYMSSMDFQVFAGASMIWDRVASEGLLPRRGSGER